MRLGESFIPLIWLLMSLSWILSIKDVWFGIRYPKQVIIPLKEGILYASFCCGEELSDFALIAKKVLGAAIFNIAFEETGIPSRY